MTTTNERTAMMRKYLQIRNYHTGEVASKMDVTGKSDRQIERIERGALINMDTDNWCIEEVEEA